MSDEGEHPPEVVWAESPDDPVQRQALKRQLIEQALERGKIQIRLDARRPGVRVPERNMDDHALALNLSWRFAHTDMVLNERGLAATLRFGGQPFRCILPWSCLWALLPAEGHAVQVWPQDLPAELGGPERPEDEPMPPPVEPMKPKLAVVAEAPASAKEAAAVSSPGEKGEASEPPPDPRPPSERAPWLKLVR